MLSLQASAGAKGRRSEGERRPQKRRRERASDGEKSHHGLAIEAGEGEGRDR